MLSNLQVLRGVAALGVVFFHTDYGIMGDWHTEFFGVSIFFVISGFIMCLITRDNAEGFLKKRVVRIVPLYWFCTIMALVVMFGWALFDPQTWLNPLDDGPAEPLWTYVGRGLLFLPIAGKYPFLNVGWSLHYEMYFYLIFAVALWISRRMAPLIVIGCLLALNTAEQTVCKAPVCHYLAADYIRFFIAGIAIFYVLRWLSPVAPKLPVVWFGTALITLCYGSQFTGPWWSNAIAPNIYLGLAAAAPIVIVASALMIEETGVAVTWRPLILIGDASYAIYLTHPIVFDILRAGSERWFGIPAPKDSIVVMLAYLGIASAAGIAMHLYIEIPILGTVRRWSNTRSASPPKLSPQRAASR